jgi:hypothetical protein
VRLGLVLFTVLLFGMCSACAPQVQRPFAACPFSASQKVVELSPTSDAAHYGSCAWRPGLCTGQPTQAAKPTIPLARMQYIQSVIQGAFDNAPANLQNELCTLHQVYIDPKPNSLAWGLRDARTGSKDIGIPDSMIPEVAVQPYAGYETSIVKGLLVDSNRPPAQGSLADQWLRLVSHAAVPDNSTIQIMAILAHEMGHILWYSDRNNKAVPALTCPSTGTTFDKIAWAPPFQNPRGFHGFGKSRANHTVDGSSLPAMSQNLKRGTPDSLAELTNQMKSVYTGGNWPDLFGIVDADEDFIETYKFWALTHAQGSFALQSLSVQFSGSGGEIPIVLSSSFGTNPLLSQKRKWVEDYVNGACH